MKSPIRKLALAIVASVAAGFCANAATQLTLNDGDTLSGEHADATITIAAGATVTFDGVTVVNTSGSAPAVNCLGNATIILADGTENAVTNMANYYSAIYPAANATLTIQGAGSLYVAAPGTFRRNYSAAIGSYSSGSANSGTPCGNIVIAGGNITAAGGYCGAGIGSCSYDAACGDITITGNAVVTATGGEYAASVGASSDRSPCGNITISGNASVTATKDTDTYAAGIGAGYDSDCGSIVISTTGTVTASGSRSAAIGAGQYPGASCAGITITSGTVVAQGGNGGCGIGASYNSGNSVSCGNILIEGGTITAANDANGAGIGTAGSDCSITITGGDITASGADQSAAIGSIYFDTCGDIVISGGTVTATGGKWAAGIGSSYKGTCGNITISGGTVTAGVDITTNDNETDTAAIGAGCRGTCGDILISGGIVVADAANPQDTRYDNCCAIGATYVNGKCGNITITDRITSLTVTKGASAQEFIGQGDGQATVGTVTISPHLAQTLSNDDLTATYEPHWVEIGNVTQLKAVANDLSGFYRLTADIDLANESWRLGTFTGIFDGNGHTISNINCNNPWDPSGFFQTLGDGAVVRNLSLRGGMVTTYNGSIGGLAGTVSGNVLVEDCTIDVLVNSSAGGTVGGFVGYISGEATLTLRRCRSLSAVVGRYDRVGGLVGYTYWKPAVVTVEDCYVAGSVKGSGLVGGIVGCPSNSDTSLFTISNSYSVAELTGSFGSPDERVGELNSRVVIIGKPTILDNFPTNIVNVRTRGTGAGTASYDAATSEFTATPNSGSAFYGWEGLPPKEGDYNERTVWAVFGRPVATASDFNNMDAGGIYVQTADIDLAGESGAIGYNGVFTGCYNGGNHEIRNMVKNGGYYSHGGLFSQMEGAVVKNLRIVDANVTGGDGTAVLVGYAVKSTIKNVRVEGGSVKGSGNNIGGLVGQASSGLFEECMSSATVEGNEALGGLVGHGGGSITVRRSYATGDVTGSRYAGGFIGNGDYINFTDCYALGAVTATNSGYYAGGFIAGGVGVWNAYFAFTNCYSAGAVSGEANSGGFDSSERYSQRGCTNCYWDAEASGKNSSYVSGVTGLTTAQMKSGEAFEGWDTDVWKFAEGQYPRLRAFIPKYTVTWLDENGETVLGESVIDEGDTPVYDGETLTKEGNAQYTYTFAGWTPDLEPIESNTTYTATYDATVNEYTITWLDADGSVLDASSVEYGETPTHANPSKAATAQYTYTFAGWTPAVVAVTGTATYKATFTPVLRSYTITWKDDDGTTLGTDTLAYGSTPSRADPEKEATAQYTYTFTGWSPAVDEVKGDATYTATYSETVNTYTITFKNHDGSTLQSGPVDYGTTPAYSGETPTKPDDTYNTYTFDGWNPAVVAVTGNQTYTAQFSQHSKWTGSGTSAEPYTLATPARISEIIDLYGESVPDEIYVRTGGDVTAESISAQLPAGYAVRTTATPGVVKVVQTVTVVWYDEDGETVLERDEDVDIGSMPSFDGATPTKAATAQYTYEFNGWTPTVVAVTESASYTATYTETLRSYTITWLDADGSLIDTTSVDYGETPVHPRPVSVYTFTGWSPALAAVSSNTTYTATFSQTVNLANLTGDYTAADGDVLTGTTAHNVTIPGGATVTVNGVSITGAGGGAAPEAPSFREDAETAVARIEKGADGKWTIVAFAELATGTAAGVDGMVTILRGDSPDDVTTEVSPDSLDVVNAVKVKAVVVPPVGKDKQFFKVEYGSK